MDDYNATGTEGDHSADSTENAFIHAPSVGATSKKGQRKKRKAADWSKRGELEDETNLADDAKTKPGPSRKGGAKKNKGERVSSSLQSSKGRKGGAGALTTSNLVSNTANSSSSVDPMSNNYYTPIQQAFNERMKRALEEEKYSAAGSIVEDSDTEDKHNYSSIEDTNVEDEDAMMISRSILLEQYRKRLVELAADHRNSNKVTATATTLDDEKALAAVREKELKDQQQKALEEELGSSHSLHHHHLDDHDVDELLDKHNNAVGQAAIATQNSNNSPSSSSSNAVWVECEKCKKWRRLRGVIDSKKLEGTKWYCSMNKGDPERAKCSAPEEPYVEKGPESAADHRIRKHLRLWVRRLQSNDAYEARLPTMTRGKKKSAASSSEPYEWVRCSNPSCGKWRAVLRFMDASNIVENAKNGKWYCVLNTWDEKMASCAAPQENLPAIGCPSWVMQDDD